MLDTPAPPETAAVRQRGAPANARWQVALPWSAIAVAYAAQHFVEKPDWEKVGGCLYAVAVGLFVAGCGRRAAPTWAPEQAPSQRPESVPPQTVAASTVQQAGCALAALIGAAAAYTLFAGNQFTVAGVVTWASAVAFLLAGFADTARMRTVPPLLRDGARTSRPLPCALVAITLLAAFFLLYRLPDVPAEMTSDHAEKLLDVNDVRHGAHPIFFLRNTGREPMQFYLAAAVIWLTALPLGHVALKVVTASVGLMTVPLTYLLGRQLYGRSLGLLTAALLAVAQWHIAISRVGLRFPFAPAFAVPTLLFLFRAFTSNRRNDWLACGAVLGIGMYGYTPIRIMPFLLVVLASIKTIGDGIGHWRSRRTRAAHAGTEASALNWDFWRNALLGSATSLLVALPLLRFMHDDPQLFWYRALTRASELERDRPGELGSLLAANLKRAALMFNYRGDVVWVNTVPGAPVLDSLTAALFVLGVGYLGWRIAIERDRRALYLAAALFVLLLPSVLSLSFPEENPSVVRASAAAPMVMLIAALPLAAAVAMARHYCGAAGRWLAGALVAATLMTVTRSNYIWYFYRYEQQYRRAAWNTREMGSVIRGFALSVGDMDHAYHVAYPDWADTRNIAINAGDIRWANAVTDIEQVRSHANDPAAQLYLAHPDDRRSLSVLREVFPTGQLRPFQSETPGKEFFVFFVPAR